ncbi:MAG: SipW-dependent-type signal peptide-containing protein, partial [Clostridia bacterium]|nr:SipW-dependent-type signal peptide-containing protein [Clostridia bacterium]
MANKSVKRAFLASLMALILCVSSLLGTTYAWFTDSVTSANNKIVAGNLD